MLKSLDRYCLNTKNEQPFYLFETRKIINLDTNIEYCPINIIENI